MANEEVDFIPYAELTPEQKAFVDSEDYGIRFDAVDEGLGWDKLVNDPSPVVREQVASHGYAPYVLINDPHEAVRSAVADIAPVDLLVKLIDDPSWEVRQHVAFRDYGLDRLVDDPDPRVRFAVAKRDFGLDKLIDDVDEDVRLVVACKINEPDRFAVDPDKFVNVFSPFGRKGPSLEEWISQNPDKCALPENKNPTPQQAHAYIPKKAEAKSFSPKEDLAQARAATSPCMRNHVQNPTRAQGR